MPLQKHPQSRTAVLEVEWSPEPFGPDHATQECQAFTVVRSLEEHQQGPIAGEDPTELTCEVCEEHVGLDPYGDFVPYSVDESTIVLCEEHCKESVLQSIWPEEAK